MSNLIVSNTSTFNSSLNVSGVTTFQGASTHLSSLNVSAVTKKNANIFGVLNVSGNITGSRTALTNLNYIAITNPPSIPDFNNPSTFISSLNVSE